MPGLFLLLGRWFFCHSSQHSRGTEVVICHKSSVGMVIEKFSEATFLMVVNRALIFPAVEASFWHDILEYYSNYEPPALHTNKYFSKDFSSPS